MKMKSKDREISDYPEPTMSELGIDLVPVSHQTQKSIQLFLYGVPPILAFWELFTEQ